jgi:hypothetical protein
MWKKCTKNYHMTKTYAQWQMAAIYSTWAYNKIFNSKALPNLPKLVFLF